MFDSYYYKLITKGRNYKANYKSKRTEISLVSKGKETSLTSLFLEHFL